MEIRFENEVYDLTLKGHRKLLHKAVEEYFYSLDIDYIDYMDDLDEVQSLISSQDVNGLVDGFFVDGELNFFEVEQDELLADALEQAGYSFEKSNISRSIYAINDNGQEVRISDHKRPAIVQNGAYVGDHHYELEIIIKDNIVNGHQLRMNGFSKLTKNEYLLG